MSPNNTDKNSMKSGTSKRNRAGKERKPAGTPWPIIAAAVVILAGAAILFWPRGGSAPSGIGEQKTVVVTPADSNAIASGEVATRPHSSNVDIASEGHEIVPESPDGSGLSTTDAAVQDKVIAAQTTTPAVVKPKAKPKPKPAAAPEEKIIPQKTGGWAVQIGAYGEASNADKEAVRLQGKGWDARVRAGNNSDGTMVFRVWIGYFTTRSVAETFARQNRRAIPNAIAVHR